MSLLRSCPFSCQDGGSWLLVSASCPVPWGILALLSQELMPLGNRMPHEATLRVTLKQFFSSKSHPGLVKLLLISREADGLSQHRPGRRQVSPAGPKLACSCPGRALVHNETRREVIAPSFRHGGQHSGNVVFVFFAFIQFKMTA